VWFLWGGSFFSFWGGGGGGGGGRWLGKYENKIPAQLQHSGTKQRNTSQASEIKFIQSFLPRKQIPTEKELPSPSPPIKFLLLELASPTQ